MEPGSKYEDLITRYLLNEASPEEQGFVLDWMKADEKNLAYVEELKRTLQLFALKQGLDQVDINQEWEKFRNEMLKKQQSTEQSPNIEWEITDRRKQRTRIYKIVISSAVAASFIVFFGVRNGWFTNNIQPGNPINQQAKAQGSNTKIDPLMAVVQHEVNTSGKVKKFMTPDGSEISLFDSSDVTYKEPAEGNKRDVYLVGKAEFRVAKNKAKPFTVYSGDISTTAVGTVFAVTARQTDKYIRVQLDEGKVIVKSLKGYNSQWTKDLFMKPGEELTYDKAKQTISIRSFGASAAAKKSSEQVKDNPNIPNFDKQSWFMFNNQSLSEIFDALSAMYDVKISYSKQDVKDKYFIGTYDKSDSLVKILNEIALLNRLDVTKANGGFKITKKK